MRKAGILIIFVAIICFGLGFFYFKDDKKESPKEDEEKPAEGVKRDSYYYKYQFSYFGLSQVLTPGTYTINNLSDDAISWFLRTNTNYHSLEKCDPNNSVVDESYYVTEEDMKNSFEFTFGDGTYKPFTYRTDGGCKDLIYNLETKRYESKCVSSCGAAYPDFENKKVSETRAGDNTIIVESVELKGKDIQGKYELTYTLKTDNGQFISLKSEKK